MLGVLNCLSIDGSDRKPSFHRATIRGSLGCACRAAASPERIHVMRRLMFQSLSTIGMAVSLFIANIDSIRRLYKAMFQQESVLRVDDPLAVRVSF
jgi:hypothetical protein